QVLYKDKDNVLKIMSANNKADAADFNRSRLSSRLWKSEGGKWFTLDRMDTGVFWRLWVMKPSGGGDLMIHESTAEIMPPVWSADSSRIAFIEKDGTRYSVV